MKIAYVGDSFCENIGIGDWPRLVADELDAEIIQTGYGGQHFYTAIDEFLPKMHEADVIVICVTEPYRVFNRWGLPLNMSWIQQMKSKSGAHWEARDNWAVPDNKIPELVKAVDFYYNYIFDGGFSAVFNISCVSLLDKLIKQCNKKVMWFPCFDSSLMLSNEMQTMVENSAKRNIIHSTITEKLPVNDPLVAYGIKGPGEHQPAGALNNHYIPVSGPSANLPLHEISLLELTHLLGDELYEYLNNDPRSNHFMRDNHLLMAELVIDIVKKDKFSPETIKMEDYFPDVDLNIGKVVRT